MENLAKTRFFPKFFVDESFKKFKCQKKNHNRKTEIHFSRNFDSHIIVFITYTENKEDVEKNKLLGESEGKIKTRMPSNLTLYTMTSSKDTFIIHKWRGKKRKNDRSLW